MAILGGMRPGEILALTWGCIGKEYAEVNQRLYRSEIDSPKAFRSKRRVAFPEALVRDIEEWKQTSPDVRPEGWLFPSENGEKPILKANIWRRNFHSKLSAVGLGWVNFQVMRRTHASLMNELNGDPKIVAEQLGHALDLTLNTYTQVAHQRRKQAVDLLEGSVLVN